VTEKAMTKINLEIRDEGGVPMVNSRVVAKFFEKRPDHVLGNIDKLIGSPDLGNLVHQGVTPFHLVMVDDEAANKEVRTFDMTRDGFSLLVMGWTGAKALKFKVAYIKEFNRMEALINADPSLSAQNRAAIGGIVKGSVNKALVPFAENQAATNNKVDALVVSQDALAVSQE
jgi:Rha family phage regulatory protein